MDPVLSVFPLIKESHFRGAKIAKIFRLRRAQKSEFGKVVFINFSLRSEFDQGGFSLGGGLLLTIPRYYYFNFSLCKLTVIIDVNL